MTVQAEYERYAASVEGRGYLTSCKFRRRWARLCDQLDAGEQLTVLEAAKICGLPIDVFKWLYAGAAASAFIEMGDPPTASEN